MGHIFTRKTSGLPTDGFGWEYENPEGFLTVLMKTDRDYDYAEDKKGNPYYIKYTKTGFAPNERTFEIYPIEDDLYEDKYGYVHPVEWGKYYDPNVTWLPGVDVYPRTGTLVLKTFKPGSKFLPGHSSLDLLADYYGNYDDRRSVDIKSDGENYNLITNNCADATREVLETLFDKKMNPWFFTTPGDSRDFFIENGGTQMQDGTVQFKLSLDQLRKVRDFIDKRDAQKWKPN